MSINLDSSLAWTQANPEEQAMLDDLQGNILKGHGREHTVNLFLKFKDQSAKTWIASLPGKLITASEQLKAAKEIRDAKAAGRKPASSRSFLSFYLSADGYDALGVDKSRQPSNPSFQGGMKKSGKLLHDPPAKEWDETFRGEVHAMLLIGDSGDRIEATVQEITDAMPAAVEVIGSERGRAFRNSNGDGIEHFGYVDGRSQPLMLKEDVEREKYESDGISVWNPEFPLKQVLVPDPGSAASFGSYFVFRKLEQNVKAFKLREWELEKLVAEEAETRARKAGADLAGVIKAREAVRERAGALMVGRFEDGTPVVTQNAEGTHHPVPNNFDFSSDPDATRCPFHSHIRKTNPRGESVGAFAASLEEERSHIMARRGITFGDRDTEPSGEGIEFTDAPAGNVGLLFMAFMQDIGNQFEFTQVNWANNPGFVKPDTGIDPIIGQGGKGGQSCPLTWGELPHDTKFTKFEFRNFVTMKGGEYFFAPAISTLKNL